MSAITLATNEYIEYVELMSSRVPDIENELRDYFELFGYDDLMPVIQSLSQRINSL
jgi:hypothetical protein